MAVRAAAWKDVDGGVLDIGQVAVAPDHRGRGDESDRDDEQHDHLELMARLAGASAGR